MLTREWNIKIEDNQIIIATFGGKLDEKAKWVFGTDEVVDIKGWNNHGQHLWVQTKTGMETIRLNYDKCCQDKAYSKFN